SPPKLLRVVAEPRKAKRLLIVGHNPSLHEFALQLIASGDVEVREQLREKLPTSGLVVMDLPIEDWAELRPHSARLERFVTPRSPRRPNNASRFAFISAPFAAHAAASAARMRTQLRMPLWKLLRSYFSLGE